MPLHLGVILAPQPHLPLFEARPAVAGEGGGLPSLFRKREFGDEQVLQFTQQLATLLAAGQPLDRALGILLELPETQAARRAIERAEEIPEPFGPQGRGAAREVVERAGAPV